MSRGLPSSAVSTPQHQGRAARARASTAQPERPCAQPLRAAAASRSCTTWWAVAAILAAVRSYLSHFPKLGDPMTANPIPPPWGLPRRLHPTTHELVETMISLGIVSGPPDEMAADSPRLDAQDQADALTWMAGALRLELEVDPVLEEVSVFVVGGEEVAAYTRGFRLTRLSDIPGMTRTICLMVRRMLTATHAELGVTLRGLEALHPRLEGRRL